MVIIHPALDVTQARRDVGWNLCVRWWEGEKDLGVISIAVVRQTIISNNRAKGFSIKGEKKCAKDWALGNSCGKGLRSRCGTSPGNLEGAIGEVGIDSVQDVSQIPFADGEDWRMEWFTVSRAAERSWRIRTGEREAACAAWSDSLIGRSEVCWVARSEDWWGSFWNLGGATSYWAWDWKGYRLCIISTGSELNCYLHGLWNMVSSLYWPLWPHRAVIPWRTYTPSWRRSWRPRRRVLHSLLNPPPWTWGFTLWLFPLQHQLPPPQYERVGEEEEPSIAFGQWTVLSVTVDYYSACQQSKDLSLVQCNTKSVWEYK